MVFVIDSRLLAITAIVTLVYQFAFGSVAYALKFDKITMRKQGLRLTTFCPISPVVALGIWLVLFAISICGANAGGTNFFVLAVLTFALGTAGSDNGPYPRQIVLTVLVCLWALRLGLFLLYRILQWGEDQRFDDRRDKLVQVLIFWSLQAVWVWTVSLPLTILNSSRIDKPLGALDYVGWALFVCGLVLESTADIQKLRFKNNLPDDNKGQWTDTGVWKWTRHPNYFGEMLLWTAAFISAARVFSGLDWIAVLGPIFIILLLLFVSGIPMLEVRADKKHGNKEEYRAYKKRTSVLFPIPNALYAPLPESLKRTVLLDWPLYNPMWKDDFEAKKPKTDVESDGEDSPNESTPINQ